MVEVAANPVLRGSSPKSYARNGGEIAHLTSSQSTDRYMIQA